MLRAAVVLLCLVVLAPVAAAEPPAPMKDRVAILKIEMRRGPAKDLAPFLTPDAHPLSRGYAIRALGRIGDTGGAPEMLAKLLEEEPKEIEQVLWAAGIAQSESLAEPIAKYLTHAKPNIAAAAAEALGWTGKKGVAADLSPLLEHKSRAVRIAALNGLARLRPEGYLERMAPFIDPKEKEHDAAAFACWLTAGARKGAAKKHNPDWDGDSALWPHFLPLLTDPMPERVMAGIRPLGSLLPEELSRTDQLKPVFDLIHHEDPRVVQDAVWRIFTSRRGRPVDKALRVALSHDDAKVRHLAAEALGKHGADEDHKSSDAIDALDRRFYVEDDPRIREVLAIELARVGKTGPWKELRVDPERAKRVEDVVRQNTHAQVLLVTKDIDGLLAWANPTSATLHSGVWMSICSELEGRDDKGIGDWVSALLAAKSDDPYVLAAAISLVGKNGLFGILRAYRASWIDATQDIDVEARRALAEAVPALLKASKCPAALKKPLRAWIVETAKNDASAFVRQAVRKAVKDDASFELPEDTKQPNDWMGLPRPKGKVLGMELPGDDPWLNEEEILTLADWIRAEAPQVAIQTTQGTFFVEVDVEAAPVHAVSFILAVSEGVYTDTRWHRVVPNFVIQGGDPHGHGSGGGGWTVPDEITRKRYVRGALGMPKSVKDDGGCQLFFMHTAYRPLDERYSCYGHVTGGMDVVDKIRVGDRIVMARFVLK